MPVPSELQLHHTVYGVSRAGPLLKVLELKMGWDDLHHQPGPNLGSSQSCFKVKFSTDTELGRDTWPPGMPLNEGSSLCSCHQ